MKFNDNFLVASLIVKELEDFGVRNVSLSPGSRSTPLLAAFNKSDKIKTINIIDERVSGFYSLGLSKGINKATAIVTTSGTAVAELYPAIIEAFNNGIPLIVLTADRPKSLLNCGANQTINQNEIFSKNIKASLDLGDILVTKENLISIKLSLKKILLESVKGFPGPVHVNIPFKKPLEPYSFNCSISKKDYENIFSKTIYPIENSCITNDYSELESLIEQSKKGIITIGEYNFEKEELNYLLDFSVKYDFPILCDINTSLYFGNLDKKSIIRNKLLVLTNTFNRKYSPDLILHIGKSFISKPMLDFFSNSNATKILINKEGKWWDPSLTASDILQTDLVSFCKYFIDKQNYFNSPPDNTYINNLSALDESTGKLISDYIKQNDETSNETAIVNKIISHITPNSNLFLGNSSIIRDYDMFANFNDKNIYVYSNRGASGIDGIVSTALGIENSTNRETYLIIGDLSFIYDFNVLYLTNIINSKLKIILVNNNGGGIFRQLPIANSDEDFSEKSFITPHNLNFKKIVEGFGCRYFKIASSKDFTKISERAKRTTVFEIETDSKLSASFRKKLYKEIASI